MSKEIVKHEEKALDFQEFVRTLSEDEPVFKGCKLCGSTHRRAAQEMSDQGQSNMSIWRWLEQQKVDIKYGAVNNHINFHHKPQQSLMHMKALADKLQKWSKLDKSHGGILERYAETLDMQYMEMLGQISNLPIAEQRKHMELLLKISAQVATYKQQLHDLQVDQRPVDVFQSTMMRIVQVKLQNIKDPEQKRLLFEVLTEVERAAGDTPTDGAKLLED